MIIKLDGQSSMRKQFNYVYDFRALFQEVSEKKHGAYKFVPCAPGKIVRHKGKRYECVGSSIAVDKLD